MTIYNEYMNHIVMTNKNNRVSIREFTRNIYAHIKRGGAYVVTINGKESIVVTIAKIPEGKKISIGSLEKEIEEIVEPIKPTKEPIKVSEKKPEKVKMETDGTSDYTPRYACGCKMGDTRLCPKHHRS